MRFFRALVLCKFYSRIKKLVIINMYLLFVYVTGPDIRRVIPLPPRSIKSSLKFIAFPRDDQFVFKPSRKQICSNIRETHILLQETLAGVFKGYVCVYAISIQCTRSSCTDTIICFSLFPHLCRTLLFQLTNTNANN